MEPQPETIACWFSPGSEFAVGSAIGWIDSEKGSADSRRSKAKSYGPIPL